MDSQINRRIELVLSAPLATRAEIERLCDEARRNGFRGIVVPSSAIMLAEHFLAEEEVKITCRIGCASGSMDPDAKRYEAELAIDAGAHEIELVPNLALIQDGQFDRILREVRDISEAVDQRPVKVAVEPKLWSADTLEKIVHILLDSGAPYICGTQREHGGIAEVQQLRELCGPEFGIVARVSDLSQAVATFEAGANLLAYRFPSPR